jgi:hypothetical protein
MRLPVRLTLVANVLGPVQLNLFLLGVKRRFQRLANVAFPLTEKGRHSVACFRSAIIRPASSSVYASLRSLTRSQAKLEARMESLLLFRRALPSSMCRFIPALSVHRSPICLTSGRIRGIQLR